VTGPDSPTASQRALPLATTLFLLACLVHGTRRFDSFVQHFEITPAQATPAIAGQDTARWDFVPQRDTVERLLLFTVREEGPRERDLPVLLILREPDSGKAMREARSTVPAQAHPWRNDLQFKTRWDVTAGQLYQLELSLPDASLSDSLRLQMSDTARSTPAQLTLAGQSLPGQSLDTLAFASRPSFPTVLVVLGLALLAGAIRRCGRDSSHASTTPALLVTVGLATVCSVFVWESGVWRFYGEFWPDGKVYLAQLLSTAFSGEASWGHVWSLVSAHLHGATSLVPVLLAGLLWLGLPMLYGYALLSVLFGSGTLVVVSRFLKRHSTLTAQQVAMVVAMTGCHFVVLRGFVRPQTDGAGVFFTTLFVSSLVDLVSPVTAPTRRKLAALVLPIILVLGLLARIALAPLLVVPTAWVVWQKAVGRGHPERPRISAPLIVTAVGCALLAATYQSLDLWGSLGLLRATAALPEFKTLTLSAWATHSAAVVQLALPLCLVSWRRASSRSSLQVLLLTALGFLAMLLVFQVIPWYRYWAPIGPAVMVISGLMLFDGVRSPGTWRYALGALTIVGNLAWVAVEKSY
jgi:hypothetical protein